MNKLKSRTVSLLILCGLFVLLLFTFLFDYEQNGAKWASFPGNPHAYKDGVLAVGTVLDRNGVMLSTMEDGRRVYNDDKTVRKATLHVVGDTAGNIAPSAQKFFAHRLMGYSMVNGVFSLHGDGDKVHLTVDSRLNVSAYQALDGRNGCVGVYDYNSGEILCLVSSGGFDPADPPSPDTAAEGVYINRFLSSAFTPGSIFKLVTLAAAIENIDGLSERQFTCDGVLTIGDEKVTCSQKHGDLSIGRALSVSCNCVFGQLAMELGADTLTRYAKQMGLLQPFSLDGYDTAAGSMAADDADPGQLAWSGIGQGQDLVNPCAMLRLMGAIANHGRAVSPRLIGKTNALLGIPSLLRKIPHRHRLLATATADTLARMMRDNVVNYYGQSNFGDLPVCAKSGTAEVGGASPHAWFVGFVADEAHPLAFVVLVENGGGGSAVAGKVAATVLRAACQ
ncbi:MAG: penicillin-binding protein [Firmicutes bacterium]|nr:penicillin-binding protein [Bacillota bacterium]